MQVHVRAAGHLRHRMPDGQAEMIVTLSPEARVTDLLDTLGLQATQVWITRVNGQNVTPDTTVSEDDYIELFPLIGGG